MAVSPQKRRLQKVVLFEREDVRVNENGGVLLDRTLSEIHRIKEMPGRCKKVSFARDMTSDQVRSVLEVNFPLLHNRRYGTIKDDLCLCRCSQLFFILPTAKKCIEKFF